MLAQWKALLPGGQVSASTPHQVVTQLEPLAGYLGGEYLENLAAFHSFKRSSTAEKLCAQRSRHCATQRENAAKAEMAARISARQAAGLGGTGLVTQPSGNVQVRTYDRNGNYTGTTTISRRTRACFTTRSTSSTAASKGSCAPGCFHPPVDPSAHSRARGMCACRDSGQCLQP